MSPGSTPLYFSGVANCLTTPDFLFSDVYTKGNNDYCAISSVWRLTEIVLVKLWSQYLTQSKYLIIINYKKQKYKKEKEAEQDIQGD